MKKLNVAMVRQINALTKDQLSAIIEGLDTKVLADLAWYAETEIQDREYRKSLPALLKPATSSLRTSVSRGRG